jgi:diacylglycerol kinase family enzyme
LYALALRPAPQADPVDGLFDVCSFQRGSVGSTLRYLWHVFLRNHLSLPDAALTRCRRFRVETANPTEAGEVAYQIDGEYAGQLPVDVEMLTGGLRLIVSRAAANRLGFISAPLPYGGTACASVP